jgi:hypothetical protein
LGLVGHFLYQYNGSGVGPHGRLIYTEVIAALSTVVSLVWLIPFTWSFLHYPFDLLMSFAWFAAFGALFQWIHQNGFNCGGLFSVFFWDNVEHTTYCAEYKTTEGITFILAILWLISALLVSDDMNVNSRISGVLLEYSRCTSSIASAAETNPKSVTLRGQWKRLPTGSAKRWHVRPCPLTMAK